MGWLPFVMPAASPTRACRRVAVVGLAWLGLSTASRVCQAEAGAAEKEMARSLVVDGDRLFAAGEFQTALERYRAAFDLVPAPTVGVEIVKGQVALKQLLEAKATAIQVMSSAVEAGEPAVFAEARAAAERMAQSLDARIPQLVIQLPRGIDARVQVDERTIPPSVLHLPLRLNPGEHALSVSASERQPFEATVALEESEREQVVVELRAAEPAPLVASLSSRSAEAGGTAGEEGPNTRVIVALAVAGVGAATGATTGILALTSAHAVERDYCAGGKSCDPAGQSDARRSETYGTIANVSFAIAGAAALYAAWELLFNTSEPAAAARVAEWRVAGIAGPNDIRLDIVGTF